MKEQEERFKLNKYAYSGNREFMTKEDLVYWLQEKDIITMCENREIVIGFDGNGYYAYIQNDD